MLATLRETAGNVFKSTLRASAGSASIPRVRSADRRRSSAASQPASQLLGILPASVAEPDSQPAPPEHPSGASRASIPRHVGSDGRFRRVISSPKRRWLIETTMLARRLRRYGQYSVETSNTDVGFCRRAVGMARPVLYCT
jgi:hypothetical protein